MRLTLILLTAAVLQVSARGYTQTLTISLKNAPLEKVFAEIKKQTGYSFLYTEQVLQGTNKVDIDVRSATLETVLDICFKNQRVYYTIVNKTIVLKPKEESPKENATNEQPSLPASVDISGRITNEEGEPLQGANVKVKGTEKGTTTNSEGVFILKGVDADATLEISYIGYQTIAIAVSNRSTISASLQLNVVTNPEVIVRKGYYNEKRATTTGNVSTVTSKEIEKQPVNNPLLALQGRIPGMEISQSTGLPGSGVMIQIRGRNSIANGIDPLFVIDGVPYTSEKLPDVSAGLLGYSNATPGNSFSYVNPLDIESIDILKDADATAIYGSRGANGVVLITTKKGKEGKTKVDANIQYGLGKVERKMNLLNTRQYLDMRYEAFKNDGATPNPNVDFDLTLWDTARYTDWQKELIGGTAHYTNVQASVSGGSPNMQYLIGSGYHKETTVFPGNFNDQKGSVHFNINGSSSNKKFGISLSGLYTTDDNQLCGYDFTEQAMKLPPNAPAMYNPDGSLNWAASAAGRNSWPDRNPAAQLLVRYNSKANNLISNSLMSYNLSSGLDIKASFGYSNLQIHDVSAIPLSFYDPSTWTQVQRRSRFANNTIQSWIIEPQVNYRKTINKGVLSALIGTTIQQNNNNGEVLEAKGFNSDLVLEDLKSAASVSVFSTINSVYKYNALFGRLNYNWKDKYLVNLTARRDGTSRFGPANRFQNFGAVGLGWVFSKERWIEKTIPFISFGKLRASYGTTGSDQVGDYSYMDLYSPVTSGIPFLGGTSLSPTRIYTPDLAWEETRKLEAGIELGLFSDRIVIATSYYRNRSTNQLVDYSLPSITGFISIMKNLPALVQNAGLEFELKTANFNGQNFRWNTSLNITINRNKLISGAQGLNDFYQQKIGYPLTSRFYYHFAGVDPITGLYQFYDSHSGTTSNPDPSTDQNFLVDYTPKFYGGLQNSISYKSFQVDFLFQFMERPMAPVYLYNYLPGFFSSLSGGNQLVTALDRWQQPGDVKPIQRFSQNSSTVGVFIKARDSDQQIGDASYVRLKNASVSWQLPGVWEKKINLQSARIYLQGQNLLTITNYKGLDPETTSSITLPPLRVVTIGVQLTF